jgi:hypothetical protein
MKCGNQSADISLIHRRYEPPGASCCSFGVLSFPLELTLIVLKREKRGVVPLDRSGHIRLYKSLTASRIYGNCHDLILSPRQHHRDLVGHDTHTQLIKHIDLRRHDGAIYFGRGADAGHFHRGPEGNQVG